MLNIRATEVPDIRLTQTHRHVLWGLSINIMIFIHCTDCIFYILTLPLNLPDFLHFYKSQKHNLE